MESLGDSLRPRTPDCEPCPNLGGRELAMKAPKTLQEAVIYFADADNCIRYMVDHRWPQGVFCPTCGRKDVTWLETQTKWQCKSSHAMRQFTAKVGTVFEDSPLGKLGVRLD